jgi:ABC-type transporter Mla subunit MlaD
MPHMFTPPTSKPIRVTVPVTPEVLALFQRLSKAAGQSVGRAMGQWLEETRDGLEPMIDILEQHKKAPKKAIQSLQLYAGTLTDLSDDLFDKVKHMDEGAPQLASAVASAERTVQTLSKVAKGGLTPPSSNTGGKGRKTANKSMGAKK